MQNNLHLILFFGKAMITFTRVQFHCTVTARPDREQVISNYLSSDNKHYKSDKKLDNKVVYFKHSKIQTGALCTDANTYKQHIQEKYGLISAIQTTSNSFNTLFYAIFMCTNSPTNVFLCYHE